ncbi:hypothetical protein MES4922_210087 [Mesorhizobium ventifaucium]|uniref:DUF551 domain-containing protein n=1 Tax=Mesorhizobium ventifaucium TaxID=666020 RepID=A0ABN8JR32_9HYPH|nr:hypothetical protein MES4922_210087 [Mesorhizobium ventifaucium]
MATCIDCSIGVSRQDQVTDAMVEAGLDGAEYIPNADNRKWMRAALEAALASQPVPAVAVTDAMVHAYKHSFGEYMDKSALGHITPPTPDVGFHATKYALGVALAPATQAVPDLLAALTEISQRANESGTGEIALVDTIHAMHRIATNAIAKAGGRVVKNPTNETPLLAMEAEAVTRTDILREWFGGDRYGRDYEYLDANFGTQADRVVAYLAARTSPPKPQIDKGIVEALREARQFILAPAEDLLWGVVHRIDAAIADGLVPGWKPIETAPKDRLIDIWLKTGVRWCDCYYDQICGEWRTSRPSGRLVSVKEAVATHWQEPPGAPVPQGVA